MSEAQIDVNVIGQYFGEPGVQKRLASFGITDSPRPDKGDDTAYLSEEGRGVELTFTDEGSLEDVERLREYPQGALVLSNLRLYGQDNDEFRAYSGPMPFELRFGMAKSEVADRLPGRPGIDLDEDVIRWDYDGYCVFCEFSGGELIQVELQLPIPLDMH